MASKGVRSSHAISMMRSTSSVFLLASGFSVLAERFFRFSCIFSGFLRTQTKSLRVLKLKICEYIQLFNFLASRAFVTEENL